MRAVGPLPGVFLALVPASIYLDSALWKLSSRMWMQGLGYWTPGVQPWDALTSWSWSLEVEGVARAAGYITLIYELLFVVLIWFRPLRVPLLLVGFGLHLGIGVLMPLPLFGLLMSAFLLALLPIAPDREQPPVGRAAGRAWGGFAALWALAFMLGALEPVGVLARHGLGGVEGSLPRPWHATSKGLLARGYGAGLTWSYRIFGFRTHPIFLDSQFAGYDAQTRLRYCAPGAGDEQGQCFTPALRNRRWLAWHYRTVLPGLPRERVEQQLGRFVAFYGRQLDLERGRVIVQQRVIELPTDHWKAGQRQRNLASAWRTVGELRGRPGAYRVRWRAPTWPQSRSQ